LKTEKRYLYLLTLLYFIVSLVGILHHELWLDESHHWLLSRDSASFTELLQNTRYEGHPILWNLLLYLITRVSLDPLWMQVFHIILATATAHIFMRNAPFSWLFKILFVFGYFMIFEYNIISRNYILGVLFLILACSVFKKRTKKFVLLSCYLSVAANTHLIFCVAAFAMFLMLLVELIQTKQLFRRPSYLIGSSIFGVAIVVAILQIIPPHDTQFFERVKDIPLAEKFTKGFISLLKGLITIPDFSTLHFWNSNLLVNWSKSVAAVFGLLCYFIPLFLYKSRRTIFFVYFGLAGSQLFFFLTQMSASRYHGMAFILVIMGLWIDNFQKRKQHQETILSKITFLKNPIVYSILAIQFCTGIYAYILDYRYPFTSAKETAEYLQKNRLDRLEVISVTCDGTLISPYLRKKVWFLCDESYQSYCHWDFICSMNISKQAILEKISAHMHGLKNAVYVSTYPLTDMKTAQWIRINETIKIRFLKKFDRDIILRNSGFYIFEIAKI